MSGCAIAGDLGAVRNMLAAVDCNTADFARLGYRALTGAGSPFQTGLTIFLTLYVAAIGYRLLFASGTARLADGPLIALKIGAILALVTNWSVFQTLVGDVLARVPLEIAAVMAAPLDGKSAFATDPAGGLQVAYEQLSAAAAAFAKAGIAAGRGGADHADVGQALTIAANGIFLVSGGLVAILTIAIAILTAIAPLFIAMFLFTQTRGLFVGWARAVAAAGFAMFSTWTAIVLMLYVLEPWLVGLAEQRRSGLPDDQYAMTAAAIVFVFAACQIGLVLAGVIVAHGFSFDRRRLSGAAVGPAPAQPLPVPQVPVLSRAGQLAERLRYDGSGEWLVRRAAPATRTIASEPRAALFEAASAGSLYRRPPPGGARAKPGGAGPMDGGR